ncbi:DNA polymerase III subunit chi [Pasteurellaceae bacterium HPA106]|uniref:DNA polymerase III subunit chi n=1 Tax=Spirabiliibacterium pneumoniae TaxID=221400 RepID=UPI001AADEB51|nr:DNA polymerase III subunit chi [Spirabiliibacterium pneumoniae]MBE2895282.1 DNA polymerase III subunit chi [Spirabiliibacterium pneumoniae]
MAKQAQFYILSADDGQDLTQAERVACELCAAQWREGKRVLVACDSEAQALKLDDALWARDADAFVPHNLSGEITTYATPIELAWGSQRNSQRRDVLIVLQPNVPDFAAHFNIVYDFVPAADEQKAQARARYKHYRQLGFALTTQTPNNDNE